MAKAIEVTRFRYTTWLLILFILPIGMFGGSSTVLCIGADWHVAIEAGFDGSCKGGASAGHDGGSEGDCDLDDQVCDHDPGCCGDCTDFAVEMKEAAQRQISYEQAVSAVLVAWHLSDFTILPSNNASTFRPDRSRYRDFSPPLESLRTIRLLI